MAMKKGFVKKRVARACCRAKSLFAQLAVRGCKIITFTSLFVFFRKTNANKRQYGKDNSPLRTWSTDALPGRLYHHPITPN